MKGIEIPDSILMEMEEDYYEELERELRSEKEKEIEIEFFKKLFKVKMEDK